MEKKPASTVYSALITPLIQGKRAPELDRDAFAGVVAELVDAGYAGLLVAGTTGEGPHLSEGAFAETIKVAVDVSGGGAEVFAGCSATTVQATIENIESAAAAGANAALVSLPYYFAWGDVDGRTYFQELADRTPLPILIYNFPRIVGQSIGSEVYGELARNPNIIGVKDSSGNLVELERLVGDLRGEDFVVYQGLGTAIVASHALGITRFFSATSAIEPKLDIAMVRALDSGDVNGARKFQGLQARMVKALTGGRAPIGVGVKLALAAEGRCQSTLSYPSVLKELHDPRAVGELREEITKLLDLFEDQSKGRGSES